MKSDLGDGRFSEWFFAWSLDCPAQLEDFRFSVPMLDHHLPVVPPATFVFDGAGKQEDLALLLCLL